MQLAYQQQQAFDTIVQWYREPRAKPYFYLAGYAGTGKTTITQHVIEALVGLEHCVCAAPTAKAASQMSRGDIEARTMHSVLYHVGDASQEALEKLEEEMDGLIAKLIQGGVGDRDQISNHPQVTALQGKIHVETKKAQRPVFKLNEGSDLSLESAHLGVIDEASMVGGDLAEAWLGFGKKTLVLGDPAQLPPIGGHGYFTARDPDFMLTDIHRQAQDNPVIQIATKLRQGIRPQTGDYGASKVRDSSAMTRGQKREASVWADQVLVGYNSSRVRYNKALRAAKGLTGLVQPGEVLVCLQNAKERGLMNGAQYTVVSVGDHYEYEKKIDLLVQNETGVDIQVRCHTHHFEGQLEVPPKDRFKAREFAHAQAMTVHKSQGSQWGRVTVLDESKVARAHWAKWLYTGVTRCQEAVCLVL